MAQAQAFERRAAAAAKLAPAVQAIAGAGAGGQVGGQDQAFRAGLDQHVVDLGIQRHGLVGRQRPRRGGPDRQADGRIAVHHAKRRQRGGAVDDGKAHVDGRRGLVLVVDLGLGQRRAAVQAPVHRPLALGHVAPGHDATERAQDVGLGLRGHGQVGLLPVADHAQALKIRALPGHLLGGIGAAGGAEGVGVHLLARLAELFLHHVLDRQAVAVPAGHVGRVITIQRPGLDDDVLQDLVDRVADVDVAVGVGRAVVQHVARPIGAFATQAGVQVQFLPAGEDCRFALRQVAAHRELGVRQVQGGFVVGHAGLFWGFRVSQTGRGRRAHQDRSARAAP
ncbi:MAG: hypothetical protein OZX49_01780 [Immundisolibacter sp.]|nr:hypothetical protein [Immundisolibacter sp.]